MHFKQFRKEMQKSVFSTQEAQLVAFDTSPNTLKLQLHQWVKSRDLVPVKRGLYAFSDSQVDKVEIARALYSPCYISLEYALNTYGLIPDIPFLMTLVTPKTTRRFETPYGRFVYRKIKRKAFFGFNPETLMADKEKALVDYLYLNSKQLVPEPVFWKELRLQNLEELDFDKAARFAEQFGSKKLSRLLGSIRDYAAID
jgi:predicted transcriptional regulator of viral defense system